jgi:hypothetical protein
MKTFNTTLLGTLIAITLACGYSKPSGTGTSNMPAISNLNPTSATAGSPAFTLTVTGTNFASKATVNWNGAAQTTTASMAGQLSISVPASAVATAATVQITVTNPATSSGGIYGGGTPAQTSAAMPFTIN